VKNISCLFKGEKIDITKSDYDEKKLKKFLPEVLCAIRGKKKLLKKPDHHHYSRHKMHPLPVTPWLWFEI